MDDPITEDWLSEVGFKWHQGERQPNKHWTLWLGWGSSETRQDMHDIGIEITMSGWPNRFGQYVGDKTKWMCWIARKGSYGFFVRDIKLKDDVIKLVEALTGEKWNPENHMYGNCYAPELAKTIREKDCIGG